MIKIYTKLALKVLLRHKFFTFVSLFGISFTLMILLVTAAFFDHMLGPAYPESNQNRCLYVLDMELSGPEITKRGSISYYFLNKYVKSMQTPEAVSITSFFQKTVTYNKGKKYKITMKYCDSEFWKIMDFEFLEGKPFIKGDVDNINQVAVINEATKEKYFGSELAVGKYIEADWKKYKVVGVVKDVPIIRILAYGDVWVPITNTKEDIVSYTMDGDYQAIILAKSRKDFPAIKAEFQKNLQLVEFRDEQYDSIKGGADTILESTSREMFGFDETRVHLIFAILIGLMVLFMILPVLNLVNININRIMERYSEIGIRKSFGASTITLVGQFIVENVILTLIGGIIGFILTGIVLAVFNSTDFIPYSNFTLNFRIFGYALLITLFFGLFSGVYPAWR
ncbi:MAG: ABC transporter permease, partial [Candidatus Cloacimonetes bacterium]|nr:ABC transporter permease [Candidatus Cloacimonadota bacterium]